MRVNDIKLNFASSTSFLKKEDVKTTEPEKTGSELPSYQLNNHFINLNKINFASKSIKAKPIIPKEVSPEETEYNAFVKEVTPKIAEFLEIENFSPDDIELMKSPDKWIGYFDEPTGKIFANEKYINEAPKNEIIRTIGHELTHLSQFTLMYKYLGAEKFADLLSNNANLAVKYNPDAKFIKKYHPEKYKNLKKEVTSMILEDIKNSPVYQKADKLPELKEYEKEKAEKYITAFYHYVDPKEDEIKYQNNLLESEAYEMEDLVEEEFN